MARSDDLKASPPMFESPLLDRFTRVHPSVPPIIFVPIILLMLVTGFGRMSTLQAVLLLAAGYVFWTLFEYWLHRVVFHFEPYNSAVGMRLHWMIHGVHHDHPNDPLRLVMPPSVSLPLGALVLSVFWLLLGYDAALVFGGGFLAGYLAYDMLHYHVHHHKPRTALGHKLRELHMRHHFQDDETGFGISAPYWDNVFGTSTAQTGNRAVAQQQQRGGAGSHDRAAT
ncbi:sterol desaturase family protein [Baekduia sp. Peel2402]|uniref:sterol desaturase family protein n=1 Tax=Baekduia sp. Peel2402 TaxID=3458296 RepID=UPI00403E5B36